MNSPEEPWSRAETNFGHRGIDYYIAGRFASLAQRFPVNANLMHHAVEMLLKGMLCEKHSRAAIYAMRHNLKKVWKAFKAVHAEDPSLTRFDPAVRDLAKFERIRYPHVEIDKGMGGGFSLFREHVVEEVRSSGKRVRMDYSLSLEDIDELVVTIFAVAQRNPHFYLGSINDRARAILNEHNRHPFPPAPDAA